MNTSDLIIRAELAGISLSTVEGRLVADAPEGSAADLLLVELRQHRDEVAELVAIDEEYVAAERTAIREADGGR